MQKLALFPATTRGWHVGNLPSGLGRAGGPGLFALALMATPGAAETPANLDAYCAKTYGAGAIAGFDRRDNGPLCTERTNRGLGLLHHKVDPSAVCQTQQNTVRYRKQGRQIFCLAADESPNPDRKVDLAEYCRSTYGPSAIVSRRLTDNQPLCTVKGGGGLSQTYYAIDLDELCGGPTPATAIEGDTLDCAAASRQASRGGGRDRGGGDGSRQVGGQAPDRQGNETAEAGSRPDQTSDDDPGSVAARKVNGRLDDCYLYAARRLQGTTDTDGEDPIWGGVSFPCAELTGGWTTTAQEYCVDNHEADPNFPKGMMEVRYDGDKPYCWARVVESRTPFHLLGACAEKFKRITGARDLSGDWSCSVAMRWENGLLNCFLVETDARAALDGGQTGSCQLPPSGGSEPDELVEAEM